jgi:leader peptidase (prepilin peptidase)/N-methyltransferase
MIELLETAWLAHLGYDFVPWWGNLLLAFWLWSFGANVGSFMNVVVHRVPHGLSVVHPGSRCPNCREPIRWHDNIPVFSWLWLRARCRFCGTSIAARYPLVEALMGTLFLLIGFLAPISLENVPLRIVTSHQLGMLLPWLMYGYQMFLVSTLVCAALIRWDGQRVRWPLWLPAFAVGWLAPQLPPFGLWLVVRPWASVLDGAAPLWLLGLVDSLTGMSVGLILVMLVRAANRQGGGQTKLRYELAEFLVCGLMLGWQLMTLVMYLASLLQLGLTMVARQDPRWGRIPFTAPLTIAVVTLLVTWPGLQNAAPLFAQRTNMAVWSSLVLIQLGCVWLTARLAPRVQPREARDFATVNVIKREETTAGEPPALADEDWDPFVDEPETEAAREPTPSMTRGIDLVPESESMRSLLSETSLPTSTYESFTGTLDPSAELHSHPAPLVVPAERVPPHVHSAAAEPDEPNAVDPHQADVPEPHSRS